MFGYIKIDKPELKMKEYEVYHTVYCSLCKELGRRKGLVSRLSLNYDFTFLALLKLALTKECPAFASSRCSFNPLIKCGRCTGGEDVFAFTCAAAGWVLYYKALDAIADSRGLKRLGARVAAPFLHNKAVRGSSSYPELEPILKQMGDAQRQVEQRRDANLDEAAHPTADMLGKLFSLTEEDETQRRVLYRLGYCLGRYVYYMDAADDIAEDLKAGSYNPFLLYLNITQPEELGEQKKKQMDEVIQRSANEALETFYLLKTERYEGLIENILGSGLEKTKAQILYGKKEV